MPFLLAAMVQQFSYAQDMNQQHSGTIVAWGTCSFDACQPPTPNSDFVAIAAGAGQIFALAHDGSIAASCPPPSTIRCQIPEPNSDFVAIAAGWFHGLGLKDDGSIVAWGQNSFGQCNVPAPNSGFVALAAGKYQSLGLREDGTIGIWGCGDSMPELCAAPEPNSDFVGVAAGLYHNLGLKKDGSIVAWGCVAAEQRGQCEVPEPNSGFIAISAGFYQSLGLRTDGTIAFWGYCDPSAGLDGECELPRPNSGFVQIAAGGVHNLALREDGSIAAWGRNDSGQCDVPEPNRGYRHIAAGGFGSFALGVDCDSNAQSDCLEIDQGWAHDCNLNWAIDTCEYNPILVDTAIPPMNRYLAITPGNAGKRSAIRVRLTSLHHPESGHGPDFSDFEGEVRWVGDPAAFMDEQNPPKSFVAAQLQCTPNFRDWGAGTLYIYGSEIIPSSRYEIQLIPEGCDPRSEGDFLVATEAITGRWGDISHNENAPPDMLDISALLNKFSEAEGSPSKASAQLQPQIPDPGKQVSFYDITACVDAFRGYPFPSEFGPLPCP